MSRNYIRALSMVMTMVFLMIVAPFNAAFASAKTVYVHSNTVKVYKNGALLTNFRAR